MWLCSKAQGARGTMDVSIDTTHFRLTSRRHGWEQVAECIRQQRTVKLWMHFRAARAAREPYRRERGLLQHGTLIVRRVNAPRTNLSSRPGRGGPTFRCSRLGMRCTRLRSGHYLQRPRWRSRRGGRRGLPLSRSGCQGPALWPGHAHLAGVF